MLDYNDKVIATMTTLLNRLDMIIVQLDELNHRVADLKPVPPEPITPPVRVGKIRRGKPMPAGPTESDPLDDNS